VKSAAQYAELVERLVAHYREHKRDLPWRRTRDPYSIWISEIMLQQTRVAAAIPYYERWLTRFPTVRDLAEAPLDDVLSLWSGLGYYSRARNLHRAAAVVVAEHSGEVPRSASELKALPGIGRYTAGAIASIAHDLPEPIVDGNVARVFARVFGIEGDLRKPELSRKLWQLAADLVPDKDPGEFNQALMELGATVCTPRSPECDGCPLGALCQARRTDRQNELPTPRKRVADRDKPAIELDAVWVVRNKKLLLARRAPGGLYGGLWELPSAEDKEAVAALTGLQLNFGEEPAMQHRQVLSHRRLMLRVWRARARGRLSPIKAAPYDRLQWFPLTDTDALGLSSATRSIVEKQAKQA
jgi:A/G-specific adenine glycosylase